MRFLFCLILLSCISLAYSSTINDTDLIRCTSRCSTITVLFSEALIFPPECQDSLTDIYDSVLVCGIDYTINYDIQQITIDFQASNDTGSLHNEKPAEFLEQTISLGFNYERNVTTRKYACNTNNDCARKFYLDTIGPLINENKPELDTIKTKLYNSSLITGDGSRRRCHDSTKVGDKPSVSCKHGFCFARYTRNELNDQQDNKTQTCDTTELRSYLLSKIVHHNPQSAENERETLEFRCNKNICNRNDMIDGFKHILNQYTGWKSVQQENRNIHEKKLNLSTKQTIASYVLVLFSLFIQFYF